MTLVKPLNQQMPDICPNKIRNTPDGTDKSDMYRYISDLSVLILVSVSYYIIDIGIG